MLQTTITISDKAKAVAALNNEVDELFRQAAALSNQYIEAKNKYIREIKTLSGQHNAILDSICAMEEAINKIIVV